MSCTRRKNRQKIIKSEVTQNSAEIAEDQSSLARGKAYEQAWRDQLKRTVGDARIATGTALELMLEALARMSDVEEMLNNSGSNPAG